MIKREMKYDNNYTSMYTVLLNPLATILSEKYTPTSQGLMLRLLNLASFRGKSSGMGRGLSANSGLTTTGLGLSV